MSFQALNFSAPSRSSKTRISKKGIGLGINVVAASMLSASSSAYRHMKSQEFSSSSSSPKPVKTRPRSSTTASTNASRPASLDVSNATVNTTTGHSQPDTAAPLEEDLSVLKALWTKPAYYEELHTLSAYGELPVSLCPLPLSPHHAAIATKSNLDNLPSQTSEASSPGRLPTSLAARLFEVAKPPAMAKRRRYTVATSRPSLVKVKEKTCTLDSDGAQSSARSDGLEYVKEEGSSSIIDPARPNDNPITATNLMKQELHPLPLRSSSVPCEPLASCSVAVELQTLSSNLKLSSGEDVLVPLTSASSATPTTPATSRPPRGVNVNVRYIKHYPYMITELANPPRTGSGSEAEEDGVLSRTKYCLVRV
ncbi:hypothetical protein DFJ43DRAFT_1148735 [Lentinula guzmanii]|uniref:Uncharacterized protein n=1 Tax=Lentinula guzmanii TaxID=2804957 RepID=A0AA38N4Z9_9AGAR|nr:hypothetical protein DFJ43DRAFT_1148735 [Lentinula guzmanii]